MEYVVDAGTAIENGNNDGTTTMTTNMNKTLINMIMLQLLFIYCLGYHYFSIMNIKVLSWNVR